jgi:hypothetical protein
MFNPNDAMQALNQTILLLQDALYGVTTEQARQAIVGPDDRSVLSLICHMRDYERVIQQRVWLMTQEDHPVLPPLHGEEVSHRQDYSHEEIGPAMAEFIEARADTLTWLDSLSDDDWRREGAHSNLGEMKLIEVVIKQALHDAGHVQQIMAALGVSQMER